MKLIPITLTLYIVGVALVGTGSYFIQARLFPEIDNLGTKILLGGMGLFVLGAFLAHVNHYQRLK